MIEFTIYDDILRSTVLGLGLMATLGAMIVWLTYAIGCVSGRGPTMAWTVGLPIAALLCATAYFASPFWTGRSGVVLASACSHVERGLREYSPKELGKIEDRCGRDAALRMMQGQMRGSVALN